MDLLIVAIIRKQQNIILYIKRKGKDNAANFSLGATQYYMKDNVSALNNFEQALALTIECFNQSLYNMARILQDQKELDKV